MSNPNPYKSPRTDDTSSDTPKVPRRNQFSLGSLLWAVTVTLFVVFIAFLIGGDLLFWLSNFPPFLSGKG